MRDDDEQMRKISFRIDAETAAALDDLERREGPDVRGRRSQLLRRLILAEAGRDGQKKLPSRR